MKKARAIAYIITSIAILIVFTNKVEATTAKVTTETLNLRSEASTDSSVVTLLNADDELEVISEEGNWYKVKFGSKEGYVSKDYVKLDGSLETTASTNNSNTEVATTTNNTSTNNIEEPTSNNISTNKIAKISQEASIKILPLINSNSLGTLNSDEEVTIIAKTNRWVFVGTDEISGWILNTAIVEESAGLENTNEEQETTNQENGNPEEEKPENTNQNTNNPEEPEITNQEIPDEEDNPDLEEKTNSDEADTTYSSNVTKYVNASSVYVRSEPSTSSSIVVTLIKNTDVVVTGENGDWYKVKYGNYLGYIYKELLSDSKAETTNRSGTDIDRNIENTNETTDNSTNIENATISSKGEEIVAYAKQYLGCPYVYGGSGSASFDCSGFTMYVYKHFGYSLSHSATAQSKEGTYVAKENLQPGDLVFFLDYETMDGIGHCGIYIGDGSFIHASSGTGYCVKISDLTTGSYEKRYATARRLF